VTIDATLSGTPYLVITAGQNGSEIYRLLFKQQIDCESWVKLIDGISFLSYSISLSSIFVVSFSLLIFSYYLPT
jgi:hypothetical protein